MLEIKGKERHLKGNIMNKKLSVLFGERGGIIHSVEKETSIIEAVGVLNKFNIGALIVLDKDGVMQGIVTERDIMKLLGSTNEKVGHLTVEQTMTPKDKLIIGNGKDEIGQIMGVMRDNNIRHIPIVDDDNQLQGILSMRDIIRILLTDSRNQVKDLNNYVMAKYPV